MPHVFISYRSEAQAHALEYVRLLEEAGIPCWIACRDIPVGRDYIDEIPQAIEDCNFFLLLLSPNVHTSPWVKSEVKQAISDGKLILPLQLEPFTLDRGFHFMTRNYQIYHMYDQTRNVFEEVIRVIAREYPQAQPKAAPKRRTSIPAQRIRCRVCGAIVNVDEKHTRCPHCKALLIHLDAVPAPAPAKVSPMDVGEPYEGDAPYIFISYSHKDADYVLPIIRALQERGFRVWYDEGIAAGSEWAATLSTKINHCHCFLPFISSNYTNAISCRQELLFALQYKKNTLACYLEDFELPMGMQLQLNMHPGIFAYQYNSVDDFLDHLITASAIAPCKAEQ